jgi:hypothetical protein
MAAKSTGWIGIGSVLGPGWFGIRSALDFREGFSPMDDTKRGGNRGRRRIIRDRRRSFAGRLDER